MNADHHTIGGYFSRCPLVIVDTPALESRASLTAIKAADLSIVPAKPATFDIWASEVAGRKLNLMDKEFIFLLNQCPRASEASHMREGIAALEAVGNLFRPYIRARAAFRMPRGGARA